MKATLENINIGTTIRKGDDSHTILTKGNGVFFTSYKRRKEWRYGSLYFSEIEKGGWEIEKEMLLPYNSEDSEYILNGEFDQYINGIEEVEYETFEDADEWGRNFGTKNEGVIFYLGDLKVFTRDSYQSGNDVYAYAERGEEYFTILIKNWEMEDFIRENVEIDLEEASGQIDYERMIDSLWRNR